MHTNLPTCIYVYICTHLSFGGASTTSNNKPSLSLPLLRRSRGTKERKIFFFFFLRLDRGLLYQHSSSSSSSSSRSAMLKGERTLLTETGKWDDRTFISSFIHLQSIFNERKKENERNGLVCSMKKKKKLTT